MQAWGFPRGEKELRLDDGCGVQAWHKRRKERDNAIRLLSKMFSIERTYEEKIAALSDEFKISVTKEMSREVLNVCNLSTGVYNKGVSAGWQDGVKEGEMKAKRETAFELANRREPAPAERNLHRGFSFGLRLATTD